MSKPFKDSGGFRGSAKADITHLEIELKSNLATDKTIRFTRDKEKIVLSVPRLGKVSISKINGVKLAKWILKDDKT